MKKILIFFSFSILFILGKAQEETPVSQSEQAFVFEPRFIDSINQTHAFSIEKIKVFTYEQVFKISNYILVDSISSINEIKESTKIHILVKISPSAITDNPKNYFRLLPMEVNLKENSRKCQINTTKHFVNSTTNYNLGLPIGFNLINDNTIQLTFENLPKGEYAFKIFNTYYTFSIV